ncbi:hypothetical protein O0L34_g517 [Tuta absoluta]|nr:hypothetical protein O0L34_g517 [Tuta absoluta]
MVDGEGETSITSAVRIVDGGCNKYDNGDAGLVKSLSRPGGEAGSVPAPHIAPAESRTTLALPPAFRQKEGARDPLRHTYPTARADGAIAWRPFIHRPLLLQNQPTVTMFSFICKHLLKTKSDNTL